MRTLTSGMQREGIRIGANMVDDVHFAALGIPVLEGRAFDTRDGHDRAPTVLLNRAAARELFGSRSAVGQRVELGVRYAGRDVTAEVIGVVGDVLYDRPESGVMPEAYYSYREAEEARASVSVRTRGEPEGLVTSSIGDRRAVVRLRGVFAAITLLLALTGTWSLVAYMVADRRRELGLRMALGARAERVVRGMLAQGVRAAAAGVVVGLLLGRFTSRLLESLLWETEPTQPSVYAGGAALLLLSVIVASWLPARRAARVDPVEALRAE